ncbi:MAG: glycosyltransferase [Gemmatimonadota bacterium]|nr:glycosyltransferase [Gemmatimonadota bacterium]
MTGLRPGITVCIPTIPPRSMLLNRAVRSVMSQTVADTVPVMSSLSLDAERRGAAATRQAALDGAQTEWTAFLDDDDEFLPGHLDMCLVHAETTGADYVYPWYHVIGGTDPRPEVFGQPWDPEHPVQTTITVLVRTELAQAVGFRTVAPETLTSPDRLYAGEDWDFTQRCLAAGARISHLPARTWNWYHHGQNTSGLPHRW